MISGNAEEPPAGRLIKPVDGRMTRPFSSGWVGISEGMARDGGDSENQLDLRGCFICEYYAIADQFIQRVCSNWGKFIRP